MDFVLSAIPGLAIALGLYFLFLVATKGLPAAWAWLKGVWTAGKADLASLEQALGGEIDELKAKVDSNGGVLAALQKGYAELVADVAKLKGGTTAAPAAPPAPAPQSQPQA